MVPVMVLKLKQIVQRIVLQVKLAVIVNLTSHLTDLNAVIPHGMSLESTVLI